MASSAAWKFDSSPRNPFVSKHEVLTQNGQSMKQSNPTGKPAKTFRQEKSGEAKAAAPQIEVPVPAVYTGRKVWNISGTQFFAEDKVSLKPIRTQLNTAHGTPEAETKKGEEVIAATPAGQWAHHITKGPDHPHVRPFFREVRLGQHFTKANSDIDLQKISEDTAAVYDEDGIKQLIPALINPEIQVTLTV